MPRGQCSLLSHEPLSHDYRRKKIGDLLFRNVNFRFWYVTVARFSDDFTRFFAINSIRSTLTLLVFFRIECFDPPSKRAM